jgi:drug/metabolite transporter (DMT)-like permease
LKAGLAPATAVAQKPLSDARLYGMIGSMIVSWALNFVIGKIALREIPALVLPGLRIGYATLLLIPIYLWDARRDARRRARIEFRWSDAPRLLIVGLCGITFNQFFFIAGLSRTSVGHMAVFISLSPIFVLAIAVAAGQERLTGAKAGGVLLAAAGVVILESSGKGTIAATPLGDFFALLGTLAFAVYTVASKDLASRYGSIPINMLAYSVGSLTLLPVAWIYREGFRLFEVSAAAWWSVTYMAVFSSVLAYLIYYHALKFISASRLSMFTYAEPVIAAALGFVILGEAVTWTFAAGAALVLSGVWTAERV